MKLSIEPLTAEAFAPYGSVIRAPAEIGRTRFHDTLANTREGARPTISASRAMPKSLPLESCVMERHRFSSQTFLPLDVARYLVIVAPDGPDGMPDAAQARGFVVDGNTGITYGAGTWHHAMIVLDRAGCFAVLMWRDGTPEDMETVSLDELLHVPAV